VWTIRLVLASIAIDEYVHDVIKRFPRPCGAAAVGDRVIVIGEHESVA
jgi:hypothetical protein